MAGSTKDLGRWKPQDDLLLINAVQQVSKTSDYMGACAYPCVDSRKSISNCATKYFISHGVIINKRVLRLFLKILSSQTAYFLF